MSSATLLCLQRFLSRYMTFLNVLDICVVYVIVQALWRFLSRFVEFLFFQADYMSFYCFL